MNEGMRAREEFFAEAQELVEGLGRDLLTLDEAQKSGHIDPDLLRDIFRTVHTIKGLAGLFQAPRVATLSHELESLLDSLQLGKTELTAGVLDVLFEAVQVYGLVLHAEKEGDDRTIPEYDALIPKFTRDPSRTGASPGIAIIAPDLLAVLSEVEEHRLRWNIGQGIPLYWLRVRFQFETMGQGLEDLKAAAKPHGEIITNLPVMGDDIESIEIATLMASRASADILRTALSHLGVHVLEVPPGVPVSMPPPLSQTAPTPSPPPLNPNIRPTPLPILDDSQVYPDLAVAPMKPPPRIEPPGAVMRPGVSSANPRPQESQPSGAQTVRVDIQKLDDLMNSVADLSIVRADVERLLAKLRESHTDRKVKADIKQVQNRFSRHLDSLREGILKVRMVPLSQLFDKLNRAARQTSRELDKQVNPVITGKETEVDKLTIEELSDPLIQMIRNAIAHGIELPKEREAAGKPVIGTIAINAFQKGNHVVIEFEDDGRGIDTEKLIDKAIARGLVQQDEVRTMSRRDVLNLIFVPGLSTKDTADNQSGRGVGMDVVRTNISKLGGVIDVQSEPGINTKFTLTLPITQAIINALIVRVADQHYAIPLASVQDVGQLDADAVFVVDGREAVKWRRSNKVKTLPLCDMGRLFGFAKPPELDAPEPNHVEPPATRFDVGLQRPPMRNESPHEHTSMSFPYRPARNSAVAVSAPKRARRKKRGYYVVISLGSTTDTKRLGLIVDGLIGQQNVVIKGLGPSLKNVAGFTGATQLADQRIALVLDAPSLIEEILSHKGLAYGGSYGF